MVKDDFSYFLTVDGTDQDRAAVHNQLNRYGILGDKLVETGEPPIFSHYQVDERYGTIPEWDEDELNDILHQIALAVPGATLEITGCNETDRISQFQKRFHGDLYQMTGTVTSMEPLRDDGDVPYDLWNQAVPLKVELPGLAYELYKQNWLAAHVTPQMHAQSMGEYYEYVRECIEEDFEYDSYDAYLFEHGFHGSLYVCYEEFLESEYLDVPYMSDLFAGNETLKKAYLEDLPDRGIFIEGNASFEAKEEVTEEQEKVYILCEEMENEDAIRYFKILAVGTDKEALQKLLAAKVQQDEYGFIGQNGVRNQDESHFSSEYDGDCFVEYYICEETVLNREQTLQLLQTKDFNTTFVYPEGFRECILDAAKDFAAEFNYGEIDCEKVADDLLQDMRFKAEAKQYYWFQREYWDEKIIPRAIAFCDSFLTDKVAEDPNYLISIGSIPAFNPPANLKDIIIDCIYDVSKAHHIPVSMPAVQAETIMRNSVLRNYVSAHFGGLSELKPGTTDYLRAVTFCMNQVKGLIVPKQDRPALDSLIHNAEHRSGEGSKAVPDPDLSR